MVAIHEQYMREMYKEYGYFAGWLPSGRVALGDVGTFTGHRFEKLTTLAALGVSFEVTTPGPRADLEYSSRGAVTVTTDGEVGITSVPLAALTISFAREGATYLQASGCTEQSVDNLLGLEAALLPLCRNRTWRPSYVVVTGIVSTGPTLILVSKDRDARAELSLKVDGLGTPLSLENAAGTFAMAAKSGLAASVLTAEGGTPLFRAARMRRRLTGGRELVVRGGNGELDVELAPVAWDDVAAGGDGVVTA